MFWLKIKNYALLFRGLVVIYFLACDPELDKFSIIVNPESIYSLLVIQSFCCQSTKRMPSYRIRTFYQLYHGGD